MRPYVVFFAVLVVGGGGVRAGERHPVRLDELDSPLKVRHQHNGQGVSQYQGVVTAIDKDTLTIDGKDKGWDRNKGTYKFHALDVHKAGEVQDWAPFSQANLWQDVKVGDTIQVGVAKDMACSVRTPYVINIGIVRRPGGKLPEGQWPKENFKRWTQENFLNDIENGEDKTDEEVGAMFPPFRDDLTGKFLRPGDFPAQSRVQLAANREKMTVEKPKKKDDVKATPPEKK